MEGCTHFIFDAGDKGNGDLAVIHTKSKDVPGYIVRIYGGQVSFLPIITGITDGDTYGTMIKRSRK